MQSERPSPLDRGQLPLEFGHTTSHAEADFLVGEGNRLAYGHILAFPAWPGPLTLITGPAKAGKSHLARIFAERSNAQVAAPEEIEALSRAGGLRPLVLEDLDRSGFAEVPLFHLLNQAMRDGRPVLMTAREGVQSWQVQTEDVRSRVRLASQFAMLPTDDIQMSQMLVKLYADRQIAVEPRVIAYLSARMERSPAEAVALVELTDRLALARATAVTRTVAAEALALRAAAGYGEFDAEGDDDE